MFRSHRTRPGPTCSKYRKLKEVIRRGFVKSESSNKTNCGNMFSMKI